jgi:hypothetical protein
MLDYAESTRHDCDGTRADNGCEGGNTENNAESNKMVLAIAEADDAVRSCNERLIAELEKYATVAALLAMRMCRPTSFPIG